MTSDTDPINYDYDLHKLAKKPGRLLTFQNSASKSRFKKLKARRIEKKKKKDRVNSIPAQLSQQFRHLYCCSFSTDPAFSNDLSPSQVLHKCSYEGFPVEEEVKIHQGIVWIITPSLTLLEWLIYVDY